MDNKKIQSILQDALEGKIPSSQVELWPTVKASLVAGKHPLIQQGEKMNTTKPRRMAGVAFAGLVIVVLLALAFITPQGRAFAQSILQFFVRSESDAIPIPTEEPVTWVDLTPGVPPATMTRLPAMAIFANDCGDFGSPTCSVEQIRDKVNFTIKELGNIPEGLYFSGATGGPEMVMISYDSADQSWGLLITEQPWAGKPAQGTSEVGSSAVVEKVQIGNLTGEYYRGSFAMNGGDSVAIWDPNFASETLRWVDNGISYTLQHFFGSQTPFGKEGFVTLAESMTTQPVAKLLPVPTATPEAQDVWDPSDTYNLSVPQAEQQAGFKPLLPARLPETLSLFGASYDSEHNIVEVFYLVDQNLHGPNTDGLVLRQQVAPNPDDCKLCGFLMGNGTITEGTVGFDANLETVQIGAVTGKYVEGVWSKTDCCGWVWDPIPFVKNLRWWANGMAFELSNFGMHIEKADMIRIAESLK